MGNTVGQLTDVECVVRLLLATACGVAIGLERQYRSRTAGLRADALVATGAAVFVLFGTQAGVDGARVQVAAYVVSGCRPTRTVAAVASGCAASEGDGSGAAGQDAGMERVLGIGGYFVRSADPQALNAWYCDHLGIGTDPEQPWEQQAGSTVFSGFDADTDYFGLPRQQVMVNFRVRDLDAMLAQLRAAGADVVDDVQDIDGVGRFGWFTDPEGNRVELWQPA